MKLTEWQARLIRQWYGESAELILEWLDMAFIQVSEEVVFTVKIAIPGRDTDAQVAAARERLREIAAAEFGDGVEVGISYRLPHGYTEKES